MRLDVTAYFPAEAYDVEVREPSLLAYAPVRRVRQRGDTLDTPMLTARFSSPMPIVIHVELVHHKGVPPSQPLFDLEPGSARQIVSIANDEDAATLASEDLPWAPKRSATGGLWVPFVPMPVSARSMSSQR